MEHKPAARPAGTWRPWTIVLPGVLAVAAAGLLIVADGLAAVMGSWDTPAPGLHWLRTGAIGECVLAAAAGAAAAAAAKRASWRRAAVITAWTIVAAEFAWFLLTARLASGS